MKKADVEKLISLCEKFRAKYPKFSRVEVEHSRDPANMCRVLNGGKCTCKPAIRVFERLR